MSAYVPDHVRVANCAACGRVGSTNENDARLYGIARIAGRVNDRPYCDRCLVPTQRTFDENSARTPGQRAKLGHTKGG